MLPGAFNGVENQDVVCLFNHDPNCVLGRTASGTLTVAAKKDGLYFDCTLPDTQFARELHQSIERRDIAGCSFQFALDDGDCDYTDEWDSEERSRYVLRSIRKVSRLLDVSPVTFPQYGNTEISARYQQVSAECRSQFERRGIVIPVPSLDRVAFERLRLQLPKFEDAMEKARRPARLARRRFLLDQ